MFRTIVGFICSCFLIRGYTFRALSSKIFFRSAAAERRRGVDVALRVVVVLAGLRIDAAHRADHLRSEQDVVHRHDLREQIDARLVVHARVEEDIVADHVGEQRALHVLREAAIPAPVIRHAAAAVRDDHAQGREVLEEIGLDELHERRRVGIDVVRAGRVEVRIARRADVHHGRHVELDHLLVEGIPVLVGQRRRAPVAARRIGIQVAADEPELVDAPRQLPDAVGQRIGRCLRQLAHADEVLRVQVADAVDQIVAVLGPVQARRRVPDVMRHRRRARREDRDVAPPLALELQLRALEALADLVVADVDGALGPRGRRVLQAPRAARRETPAAPSAPWCSVRGSR